MEKGTARSQELYAEAVKYLPGGVNSPVRSFKAVGGNPLFIARGEGACIYDVDGNRYIDYVCSWGPLIAGHAHPVVAEALKAAVEKGTSYGAPTSLEVEIAKMIVEAMPSIEMVRMVNSGTEATMSAIRLARGFTGRRKIVKFIGCYHGHPDSLLVKAGSGATTLGVPDSAGVPAETAANTITVPYNDLETLSACFKEHGEDIAAVILEPVPGNMGVVLPKQGYLEGIRSLTREYGSVLIFDEVMTGFRVAYSGAQGRFGIKPDLTCLGKIIGGGLPVGAYGGRKDIMSNVAPLGPVYQAGTLSGNPLAMTAGIETLKVLSRPGVYELLEDKTARLCEGIKQSAKELGIPVWCNRIGSMFTVFFTEQEVYDYSTALTADTARYAAFFKKMLEQGIYLPPSQFEAAFVSLAHTNKHIDRTIEASYYALKSLV